MSLFRCKIFLLLAITEYKGAAVAISPWDNVFIIVDLCKPGIPKVYCVLNYE